MPENANLIQDRRRARALGSLIFLSRWLQAPLYFGLIVAQGVYVFRFFQELIHLFSLADGAHGAQTETKIMLAVLGLIDVVMIANLLIMVIIGGYETFVSRLHLDGHPDQPEWLSHVNAGVLKVKLATALVGISSVHLLKTFIGMGEMLNPSGNSGDVYIKGGLQTFSAGGDTAILYQIILHMVFVVSAIFLAWIERLLAKQPHHKAPAAALHGTAA